MLQDKTLKPPSPDWADAKLSSTAGYSLTEALANGTVIKVTSWVLPEMGFHPELRRVQVVITVRLWKTLGAVAPLVQRNSTIVDRGTNLLWLAAAALQNARTSGRDATAFDIWLPTPDDSRVEAIKKLRVAWAKNGSNPWITIGYLEDWTTL